MFDNQFVQFSEAHPIASATQSREQRPSVCQSDEENRRQTPMASYGSDAPSAEVSVRQLKSLTRSECLTPDCKHRLFRFNKWPITFKMHRLSIYEAT